MLWNCCSQTCKDMIIVDTRYPKTNWVHISTHDHLTIVIVCLPHILRDSKFYPLVRPLHHILRDSKFYHPSQPVRGVRRWLKDSNDVRNAGSDAREEIIGWSDYISKINSHHKFSNWKLNNKFISSIQLLNLFNKTIIVDQGTTHYHITT